MPISYQDSKYTLEVRDISDNTIAEFSGRAKDRELKFVRNGSYSAIWKLNIDNLEQYSSLINIVPSSILSIGKHTVFIKRDGTPLFSGQISYTEGQLSDERVLEVRVSGWLDLLGSRYTSAERIFTTTDAGVIAWTAIDESQSLTNGDFGITEGTITTSVTRSRTYEYKNIKDLLQELSSVQNGFDFEFTPDKVFNVSYPSMGVQKDEFEFTYPGNIKSITISDDASGLLNYAVARGQGFGEGQIIDVRQDTTSQANYKLRQAILDFSEIPDVTTLQNLADEQIANLANPFRVLQVTLDGNRSPFVGSYWLGDRIKIRVHDISLYSDIDTYYRIDEIEVKIDDDDNEDVNLKLTAI